MSLIRKHVAVLQAWACLALVRLAFSCPLSRRLLLCIVFNSGVSVNDVNKDSSSAKFPYFMLDNSTFPLN